MGCNPNEFEERVHKRYMVLTSAIRGVQVKPQDILPEVYGHHASYVRWPYRIWGLLTEIDRTRFIRDHGGRIINNVKELEVLLSKESMRLQKRE